MPIIKLCEPVSEMERPSLPHIYEEEDVIDGFVSSLNRRVR